MYPVASPGAWDRGVGGMGKVTLGEKTLYSLGPGWRGRLRQSGLAEEVKLFPFFL